MLETTTFVLLAWAYIGGGEFELTRRPGLSERDCHLKAMRIEEDRGAQAWCFADPDGPTWSNRGFRTPICASCGGPLPGRKRV
jgi:hypothetical protein